MRCMGQSPESPRLPLPAPMVCTWLGILTAKERAEYFFLDDLRIPPDIQDFRILLTVEVFVALFLSKSLR